MLTTNKDFFVPLMKVLDSLPRRAGKASYVMELLEERYRPQISPDLYTKNASRKIRWQWIARWCRQNLYDDGYIDGSIPGVWKLTEQGHQWLVEHPEATHLSAKKPKSERKNNPPSQTFSPKTGTLQLESEDGFLAVLQDKLPSYLQPIVGSVPIEFIQRSNYLQIRLAGYSGCHYEIILRRRKLEIALHFESSAERSQARLRAFEPHLDELSQALKMTVQAGNYHSRGWTQLHIEKPRHPLVPVSVKEDTDLVVGFVAATFPVLQKLYENDGNIHSRSRGKEKLAATSPLHKILDQEVETIRAYLQGRSSLQLSDEKLCDWVYFCYTFGMYAEGKDLFSLVSGTEVNPWYYERTRKIAKACEQKAKLVEMRIG